MPSRSWSRILLVAAVAAGAVMRFYHLGAESVWFDEAYSIQLARSSIGRILEERLTDIHPPLYYVLLHFWMPLVGADEARVRLLSALFDLATIPAAYLVAVRLAGRPAALITAWLLALSPFHVQFAQEARMYALLCLASTLSVSGFLTFFDRDRRPARMTYVLATTVMLYTHIYSMFVIAAQVTSLAWIWWRDRATFARAFRPWLMTTAIIVLLYVPWLTSLADQVSRVQGAFWISHPLFIAVFHPLLAYAGSVPLALVFLPLLLLGLGWLRRQPAPADGGIAPRFVIVPWLLTPIVLPFILSEIGSPIFLPKYTIAASVPFAILTAVGLLRTPRLPWRPITVMALLALGTWRFHTYFTTLKKDGWRRASATLEATAQPNDVVLFYPWFNQIPYDYYRRREDVRPLPLVPDLETPLPDANAIPGIVADATRTRDRVWLVLQQGISRRSQILNELGRTMRQSQHIAAEHVELFLFQK